MSFPRKAAKAIPKRCEGFGGDMGTLDIIFLFIGYDRFEAGELGVLSEARIWHENRNGLRIEQGQR